MCFFVGWIGLVALDICAGKIGAMCEEEFTLCTPITPLLACAALAAATDDMFMS